MKETSKPSNLKIFKPQNLQTSRPYCLSIAASDTSGGAGIQRDLKTFHDIGVNGLSVITGITAQTDKKVYFAEAVNKTQLDIQLETLFNNYKISALKIGVVFNREVMDTIIHYLQNFKIEYVVMDPILHASDEYSFLEQEDFIYMQETFLSFADIITPNIPELERFCNMPVRNEKELIEAGKFLSEKYNVYIFAKGGHLSISNTIIDFLIKGSVVERFTSQDKNLTKIHGTGCLISSAITAFLALGYDIKRAIIRAKEYFYSILSHDL